MIVLAIGNSFSQDATRYLHQIAKADGLNLQVVNLYIGGCALSQHYAYALADKKDYSLEFNGETTGFNVSIREALISQAQLGWDVITLQQVSQQSQNYESYQPYLNALADYVRKYSPKSKLMLHQTWAYEQGSKRLTEELGYTNQADMFDDIKDAYSKAAKEIHADGIIPCGAVFQSLVKEKIPVYRDTFHASLGIGRYALGLTWYAYLTGNTILENSFDDFDETISPETASKIKNLVNETSK